MILRPLLGAADFELAASWLQLKENNQWLNFGTGQQSITPMLLRIMQQRDIHFLRLYAQHTADSAIGIVALQNVDRTLRTATLWGVAATSLSPPRLRARCGLAAADARIPGTGASFGEYLDR